MIYTVTLNPSLDYVVKMEEFIPGTINRTTEEFIYGGGKGINVSVMLHNLGLESTALGFIAGFTGDQIERMVKENGVKPDFIRVKEGMTRINVKMKARVESEINARGPVIEPDDIEELFQKLNVLQDGDLLILSGSVPEGLPADIYESIMERLKGREIKIAVDSTKDLLLNVLGYRPFLIKPNNHELGEMFGKELETEEQIIEHGRLLQGQGAQNVLISMAGEGAILLTPEGRVIKSQPPKGIVKNSVGAGDSMVAGFIAGYLQKGSYEEAFRTGLCAGSASAFSEGLAQKADVVRLLQEI